MEAKQVFSSYPVSGGDDGSRGIKYCCVCGAECITATVGEKARRLCPVCGHIYYRNPAPGVSVLVVEGEKVLLGKRAKGSYMEGKWCLPCGYVEYDEDFLTAAKREVKEETGLDIGLDSILSVMSNFLTPSLHSLVVVVLAHPAGGKALPGDDLDALEWAPLSGPLPDMAFAADRHIIRWYESMRHSGIPIDPRFK